MTQERQERPVQEEDRVRGWPAVALMVAGIAVVLGGVAPAWWLLRAELDRGASGQGRGMEVTPGPPAAERERLPRRVGELLQTPIERGEGGRAPGEVAERWPGPPDRWGWVDRERGVARMPIDRAIDLVLERYASEAAAVAVEEGAGEPVPAEVGPPPLDEPPGGGG